MSMTAEKVVAEALSLSPHARAFVAERLIESLDASPGDDLSPAWRDEARKRCREMDEGAVVLREAADVFAKAYATLARSQFVSIPMQTRRWSTQRYGTSRNRRGSASVF